MYRFIFFIIFFGLCAEIHPENTKHDASKEIEIIWDKLIDSNLDSNLALEEWVKYKKDYYGVDEYDLKLAILMIDNGYISAAGEISNAWLKKDTDLKVDFNFIQSDVKYFSYLNNQNLDPQAWKSLISEYEEYIDSKFILVSTLFNRLSTACLISKLYSESINYANKGIELKPDWYFYRNIALSSFGLGQYNDVIDAIEKAYELDNQVMLQDDLLIVASRSYSILGDFSASKEVLEVLLKLDPDMKAREDFIESYVILKRELEKENRKKTK